MKKIKIKSRKRLVLVLVSACALFLVLIVRTCYLQLVKGQWLTTKASEQQTREIPIESKRGTIYDRNMKSLAVSVTKYTIWCKPVEVKDKEKTAKKISEIVKDKDYDEILKLLSKTNQALVRIQRWVDDDVADKIQNASLSGIWISEDPQRYYPHGNFASYVLGHTSSDGEGVTGIELKYNKDLQGKDGKLIVSTDASGREINQGVEQYYEATQGNGIVLTIDEVIQSYAEKAAQRAYELNNAKRVKIIAMDPKTGDVLAMASKPDYDPNNPTKAIYPYFEDLLKSYDDDKKINAYYEMWRNTLISDTYEPGSTFKLITSTASVEENVIKPNEKFTCTGSVTVEGKRIKCWRYRPHGSETFEQAVQNSCNPVFVELGKRLGVSKLYDYIEGFGLTSKTNIDLVGEANSILYKEKDVGPVELATISFGQSISVTPIQLIRAVSAIANDGKLMEPRLVKAYTDNEGNVVQEVKPKTVRQVVSTETSKKMLSVMESVVTDGGGKIAYLPGYRLGGKTGTAQKVIDGVYAQGKYICSFISVAPVDDPQIVVLAIVDEPTDVVAFGSTTAGPIIKEVMSQSLEYLGVKKEYTKEEKEENEKKQVEIPDVRNLTIKEATKILEEKKLESNLDTDIEVDEKKVVTDMFPKPGVKVNEGSSIILYYNNN